MWKPFLTVPFRRSHLLCVKWTRQLTKQSIWMNPTLSDFLLFHSCFLQGWDPVLQHCLSLTNRIKIGIHPALVCACRLSRIAVSFRNAFFQAMEINMCFESIEGHGPVAHNTGLRNWWCCPAVKLARHLLCTRGQCAVVTSTRRLELSARKSTTGVRGRRLICSLSGAPFPKGTLFHSELVSIASEVLKCCHLSKEWYLHELRCHHAGILSKIVLWLCVVDDVAALNFTESDSPIANRASNYTRVRQRSMTRLNWPYCRQEISQRQRHAFKHGCQGGTFFLWHSITLQRGIKPPAAHTEGLVKQTFADTGMWGAQLLNPLSVHRPCSHPQLPTIDCSKAGSVFIQ